MVPSTLIHTRNDPSPSVILSVQAFWVRERLTRIHTQPKHRVARMIAIGLPRYVHDFMIGRNKNPCFSCNLVLLPLQSGSITISGLDPGGKSNSHSFTCSECADDPQPVYIYEPEPEPEPEPVPVTVPQPVAVLNKDADINVLRMKIDWNPSLCEREPENCKEDEVWNAFTIDQISTQLVDKGETNGRCWDPVSSEANNLIVKNDISEGTFKALECMSHYPLGDIEERWRFLYVDPGSCSGLSVPRYFDTMAKVYSAVKLNRIAYEFGIFDENGMKKQSVDRDQFLDFIESKIGEKAWIECDSDKKVLRRVVFCLEPYAPFDVTDCTEDRYSDASSHGIGCSGQLQLPRSSGNGYVSAECQPYMPYGISQNWQKPEDYPAYLESTGNYESTDSGSGSDSSSTGGTNVGAIVGGVVGGLVALGLIIALIIWIVHRKGREKKARGDPSGMVPPVVVVGKSRGNINTMTGSLDSAYKKDLEPFDPYKTWLTSMVNEYNPQSKGKRNEFDFGQIDLGQPIGEGSFGRVRSLEMYSYLFVVMKSHISSLSCDCRYIRERTMESRWL